MPNGSDHYQIQMITVQLIILMDQIQMAAVFNRSNSDWPLIRFIYSIRDRASKRIEQIEFDSIVFEWIT